MLVPIDGSPAGRRGLRAAIAIARAADARLTVLHVAPDASRHAAAATVHGGRLLIEHLDRQAEAAARRALGRAKRAAQAAGVPCVAESAQDRRPWKAILRVTRKRGCDLIVLGSRAILARDGFAFAHSAERTLSSAEKSVLVLR